MGEINITFNEQGNVNINFDNVDVRDISRTVTLLLGHIISYDEEVRKEAEEKKREE